LCLAYVYGMRLRAVGIRVAFAAGCFASVATEPMDDAPRITASTTVDISRLSASSHFRVRLNAPARAEAHRGTVTFELSSGVFVPATLRVTQGTGPLADAQGDEIRFTRSELTTTELVPAEAQAGSGSNGISGAGAEDSDDAGSEQILQPAFHTLADTVLTFDVAECPSSGECSAELALQPTDLSGVSSHQLTVTASFVRKTEKSCIGAPFAKEFTKDAVADVTFQE
jgi:hypothetical protein